MLQFSGLATMLREQGNRVMVYLVACILERLFGKDTIEDIEAIRHGISIPDIIDGVLTDEEVGAGDADAEQNIYDEEEAFLRDDQPMIEEPDEPSGPQHQPQPLKPSVTEWLTNSLGVKSSPSVTLDASSSSTSVFGTSPVPVPVSAFGSSIPAVPETATASASVPPETSVFANLKTRPNVFGNQSFGATSSSSSAFSQNFTSAFGSSSSVPRPSGSTDVPPTLPDSIKANTSFSPFGASTSAPIVSNIGDQGKPLSVFGSPFSKPSVAPSPSPTPAPPPSIFAASQSAPSGFPDNALDVNLKVISTPPSSTTAASWKWHDQASTSVLNPKVSPGQPFGTPSSTTSAQTDTKPTTKIYSSSSPFRKSSTSSTTTPTRPILPPINTSPQTSVSSSRRPPVDFTTSQSAPSLNGPTKHPPLERQPSIVDGFRPSAPSGTSEASTTPQQPPPPRMQPISLPGTPTGTSASLPMKQRSSNNLFGWPSTQSNSVPEILSPLVISAKTSFVSLPSPPISARPSLSKFPSVVESPTTTEQPGPSQPLSKAAERLLSPKVTSKNGTSLPSPQDIEMASPTAVPSAASIRNGKSKGKGKAPAVDTEELEALASAFVRTSAVVRDALNRWVSKASERVLYNDAVRRSDAYTGQRTKRQQETRSQVDAEPDAKRRSRTRMRRRVSAKYVPPQTDAELARRLKEVSDISFCLSAKNIPLITPALFLTFFSFSQNHEQHERRWAPGTFLTAVHTRVGNPAPFDYCLWLSLNPENDGTAIWVERKFDMPNAGAWVSERVFSIPLRPGAASRSPGLLVFECTSLYSVDDEIEKCVLFQTVRKRI